MEAGGEVKLGWGVTLQLIAVLVAIGIAWGTLSAKQNVFESNQASNAAANALILQELKEIQVRLGKLEVSINKSKGRF